MNIQQSRQCNDMSVKLLAKFLHLPEKQALDAVDELRSDREFLRALTETMADVRARHGFTKGIFGRKRINTVDWFGGERIALYVLTRLRKPRYCLETGVYYGGNTAFLLRAMDRNRRGNLISIDFPARAIPKAKRGARHPWVGVTEDYDGPAPGFLVPEALRARWKLIEGDSLRVIPLLRERFDMYVHDSEHAMPFLEKEMRLAERRLQRDAVVVADDIDWSNGFFKFCVTRRYAPLILTDNGKDELRPRLGMAWTKRPENGMKSVTG